MTHPHGDTRIRKNSSPVRDSGLWKGEPGLTQYKSRSVKRSGPVFSDRAALFPIVSPPSCRVPFGRTGDPRATTAIGHSPQGTSRQTVVGTQRVTV